MNFIQFSYLTKQISDWTQKDTVTSTVTHNGGKQQETYAHYTCIRSSIPDQTVLSNSDQGDSCVQHKLTKPFKSA
jgi:hypothetical protein